MNVLTLLLIPIISIILILMSSRKYTTTIAVLSAAVSVGYIGVLILLYFNNPEFVASFDIPWINSMGVRFHLAADGVSLLMALITNVVTLVSMYITLSENKGGSRQFYSLILLMQTFILGTFVAQDLFLFYVFWELSLIPAYFLLLIWGNGQRVRQTTIKFFLFTLFGSMLMLIAIIVLGNMGAQTDYNLAAIYRLELGETSQTLIFFAFILAFGIKTPIFPLHGWQADTYVAAPTSVTVMLSGIMSKMALYGIFRFVLPILPFAVSTYGIPVAIVASFGVLYASIVAWVQDDIKRMFAYISMAHLGLIFTGLFSGSVLGLQGSMIQMAAHGVNTCGLFLVSHILYQIKGTHNIAAFGGLRQMMPMFSSVFLVILFASIGLPLTNAFIGEFLILTSLYSYSLIATILAASGVILGAVYMLGMYKKVILGSDHPVMVSDIQGVNVFIFFSIIFVIFMTGVYPTWMSDLCATTIQTIISSNIPY